MREQLEAYHIMLNNLRKKNCLEYIMGCFMMIMDCNIPSRRYIEETYASRGMQAIMLFDLFSIEGVYLYKEGSRYHCYVSTDADTHMLNNILSPKNNNIPAIVIPIIARNKKISKFNLKTGEAKNNIQRELLDDLIRAVNSTDIRFIMTQLSHKDTVTILRDGLRNILARPSDQDITVEERRLFAVLNYCKIVTTPKADDPFDYNFKVDTSNAHISDILKRLIWHPDEIHTTIQFYDKGIGDTWNPRTQKDGAGILSKCLVKAINNSSNE